MKAYWIRVSYAKLWLGLSLAKLYKTVHIWIIFRLFLFTFVCYLVQHYIFLSRTTNLYILGKISLAEEDVDQFNNIAGKINKLKSVRKKKVIFLVRVSENYNGLKTVKEIDVLGKVNKENVNFSDEETSWNNTPLTLKCWLVLKTPLSEPWSEQSMCTCHGGMK